MAVLKRRTRPEPWPRQRGQAKHGWLIPFFALEWGWRWLAYLLSGWAFLEVLEYFGTLSLLVAAVSYFGESKDRLKQKHYQAWQVINTAQGKGGSGGRVDALEELNRDGIPLVGVDASSAFLQGIHLEHARLVRSDLNGADLRDSNFSFADLSDADLHGANFRQSDLHDASLQHANLEDTDLWASDLSGVDLSGASLDNADLRRANLDKLRWTEIRSIEHANVSAVKNPPEGFIAWAKQHGAIQTNSESQ